MPYSLNQSLGFVVNRLANRLKAELEAGFTARGLDITAEQWSVLARLYESDGLTQQTLASQLSKDKTNAARMLALMEQRGLIARRIDPDDNRARRVYVTDYGRSLEDTLVGTAQEVLGRAQAGFTEGQVQQLLDDLNHIYANLD